MLRLLAIALLTGLMFTPICLFPQQDSLPATDEPDDPFSLSTPRGAINRHLFFLQPETYDPAEAIQSLRRGNRTDEELLALAIQLKQIFDGLGVFIDLEAIPEDPEYRDSFSRRHKYFPLPSHPDIFVQRYESTWQYSNQTLARAPEIHKKVYPLGANILVNLIPGGNRSILGLRPWQWVGLVILIALIVAAHFVQRWIFSRFIRLLVPLISRSSLLDPATVRKVAAPLSYCLLTVSVALALPSVQLPVGLNRFILVTLNSLTGFFVVAALYRGVDMIESLGREFARRTETSMDDQLVPLASRTLKVAVAVLGAIFILQNMDIDVTALLAGVSIGGLALALAAQDTAKNFLGSISIFLDKPFAVGDFIATSQFAGSVEEVGVRSTRIRALDGAMVSIPNGVLVNETITNHGNRSFRRYQTEITITYGTPVERVEAFVEGIRAILAQHPDVRKENGFQVFFHDLGASSLNIWMAAWFLLPDFADWLRARQELFVAIMKLAKQLEISFAFPSTSVYIESYPPQRPVAAERESLQPPFPEDRA